MNTYLVALFCISAVYAGTTTKHPHVTHATHTTHAHTTHAHTTHEPNEVDGITFTYNGVTHDLVVKQVSGSVSNCYIVAVSMDEMAAVHSDTGMRALELRALSHLSTATPIAMSAVDKHNLGLCGHAAHGTMHYYTVP